MSFQWFIVHTLSGYEKKVAGSIREQASKKGIDNLFDEIVIPVEEVTEIKKGKKVNTEKKVIPGYIMIKMEMNDTSWHLVKNIQHVTGFLGTHGKPQPVQEKEVYRTVAKIKEVALQSKKMYVFEVGETVKVTDGPFEGFVGIVEEVDSEKSRLKVAVSIFGRSTPIELEFSQVAKN